MFTNVTILFLVLLVPVSGFIAWLGDRIGHKSGKKRHSVFGLRPRHTAMLFTIGSGVGIGLVSFGLMWAVSQTFRVVVRDGAALYGRNRQLKHENDDQARLLAATQVRAKRSQTEAEVSRRQAVRADTDTARANDARDTALKLLRDAQAQVQTASQGLQTANQQLSAQRQKLQNEQARLHGVQGLLDQKTARVQAAESQIQDAQDRVRAAQNEVITAEARQKQAQAQMQAAEGKLQNVRSVAAAALQEQRRQQEKTLANLKQSLADLTAQVADQKAKTDAERLELDRVTQELTQRRTELGQLIASADALRRNQITFHVGEEVARISIKPGYNVWRIEAILDSFLTAASKKAEGRGARKSGDNKQSRAVFLFPRPLANAAADTTPLVSGNRRPVLASDKGASGGEAREESETEVIGDAALAIRKSNEDVVVIALASANAVEGEPVAVQLKTYRNPIVLEADVPVAETVLDGNGSRETIADDLYAFLRRDVRAKLLAAGIIPPQKGGEAASSGGNGGRDNSGNGDSSIVSLSGNEWLQLMDDIRQAGSRAKVTVRTARALHAGDPVTLRFEVKDQQSSGSVRPSW